VVTAGDSLTKISRTYYGTSNRWDEILNANRDVIRNENVLPLGVTLQIP
jgi:nucleoid-associated protein YgaU